jgi:hypothetical protein
VTSEHSLTKASGGAPFLASPQCQRCPSREAVVTAYHQLVSGPAATDDGHYVIIDGRRWRATDPAIPEDRRIELVRILMAWRREVRRSRGSPQESAARSGVQAAKVALGERGSPPWWEQTDEQRRDRWQARVAEPS